LKVPYTALYSGVLFPLQETLKGHTTRSVLQSLERTQWLGAAGIRALQTTRLRDLLAHAGHHVPYYRRLFAEAAFDPEAVTSPEDLEQLPLLTKADIRADPEAFKSEQARRLVRSNTGGSSGEPLVFWLGSERVSHDVAAKWRATRWWGVDIGDREVVLWGSPIELGAQDRLRRLRDTLQRSLLLPAFEMSPQKVNDFIAAIRRYRPRMVFGYPSAVDHVAFTTDALGISLSDLGAQVAFVTGESLYDDQRQCIERVFGCPVANGYGGRDAGFVAHECPEGRMHVTAEDVIVEIADPAGNPLPPGQPGEIVVTHLASRDFPFIRYRTGDIATLSTERCPCGRGLPVLAEIQGRTTDFVVAQDGTVMHGLALIYVLRDFPQIDRFRIVQESLEHTRVLVAGSTTLDDESISSIRSGIRARLGDGVHVEIEHVEQIAADPSGKFRYVTSNVATTTTGRRHPVIQMEES